MRYLAIDIGTKKTGLATGDDITKIASPLSVIQTASAEQRQDALSQAIEEHEPDALVVGLPLNMDGSEGIAAERIRQFADEMTTQFGIPVHLVDERLTSYDADLKMQQSGLTYKGKKRRRDALAAAAILRGFFDSQ